MRIITVKIPEAYLRELDDLVKAGLYPSRSEAIRAALRELLKKEIHNKSSETSFYNMTRLSSRTASKRRDFQY